jgi:hypothetical protein
VSDPLPRLLDCKGIQEELGCKRAFAEAVMRALPKVTAEDCRKVYVKRADVLRYIEERTAA